MNLMKQKNKRGDKFLYYYDLGRGKGQRPSTGVFTYVKPKNQIEKNHNKEALALLETKKSEMILEGQAGLLKRPPNKAILEPIPQ